jgi:hypothetical protein
VPATGFNDFGSMNVSMSDCSSVEGRECLLCDAEVHMGNGLKSAKTPDKI